MHNNSSPQRTYQSLKDEYYEPASRVITWTSDIFVFVMMLYVALVWADSIGSSTFTLIQSEVQKLSFGIGGLVYVLMFEDVVQRVVDELRSRELLSSPPDTGLAPSPSWQSYLRQNLKALCILLLCLWTIHAIVQPNDGLNVLGVMVDNHSVITGAVFTSFAVEVPHRAQRAIQPIMKQLSMMGAK